MAAVTYTDGTERAFTPTAEGEVKVWISPSTMDSADTVAVPTLTGKTVRVVSCRDATTGDSVTATVSGSTVTIDAAGGTTNHVYVLTYTYE